MQQYAYEEYGYVSENQDDENATRQHGQKRGETKSHSQHNYGDEFYDTGTEIQ